MGQEPNKQYEKYYRLLLSAVGVVIIFLAAWRVSTAPLHPSSITLVILGLILSKVSFTYISGSVAATITNSDAFVYLAFLLGGADDAVVISAILAFSEVIQWAKGKPLLISFNTAATFSSLFCAALLVHQAFGPVALLQYDRKTFFLYLAALLSLSLAQGIINIILLLTSLSLRPGKMVWFAWLKQYAWTLVTSLSGMLIAAIVSALVYYYGFWAIFSIVPLLIAAHAVSYPYVKNIRNARRHAEEINAMHERTLEAFVTAVDFKKQVASRRVERMQIYAEGLAQLLGLSEQEIKALQAAALLHDIGNVAVPDYILSKPGKLSVAEREKMQLHTIVGAQMLEQIQLPYPLAPVVRHHHERWDGTGYPDQLMQAEIPVTARILAVLDGFESRCEDRQYRKALTREQSLQAIQGERGKAYDPQIIDLLIAHLAEFEARVNKQAQTRQPTQLAEEAEKSREAKFITEVIEEKSAQPAFAQTIHESRQITQGNYALFEIAQQLAGVLDVKQAMAIFTSLLDSVIPFDPENDTCVLYWLDDDHRKAQVEFAMGMQAEKFAGLYIKPGEGITGWTLANHNYFANTDPALDIFALELSRREGAGLSAYQTVAVFPVMKGNDLLGALTLYSRTLKSFDDDQIDRLKRATALISDVLSSARKLLVAEQQAMTDALTNLPNARYLYTHFEREKALSSAYPLTLLLADVSGFRQITEKAENKRTDTVVRDIAALINLQLRKSDKLVHFLGDQFVVLMHNVTPETASQVSARIQSALIESRSFLLTVDDAVVGISLGHVWLGEDGETLDALLNTAQIRLQADKAARHSFTETIAA